MAAGSSSGHYLCGGVAVNHDGETDITGLYAVARPTLPGCTAPTAWPATPFWRRRSIQPRLSQCHAEMFTIVTKERRAFPEWDPGTATNSDEMVVVSQNWDEIRRTMWNYVGIVRSDKRLERAMRRIKLIQDEIEEYYWNFIITSDLIELRNIVNRRRADCVLRQMRKESRGLHYNIDYPERDDVNGKKDSFIRKQF